MAVRPPAIRAEEEGGVDLEGPTGAVVASIPERGAVATSFDVVSHDILFAAAETPSCDACGGPLPGNDEDGYDPPGRGMYMWARGEEIRVENAPLCSACASAIGMTALARWEIEEEEG